MRTRRTPVPQAPCTSTQLQCACFSVSAPLQCSNNDIIRLIDIFRLIAVHLRPYARGTLFAFSYRSPDWKFSPYQQPPKE